jgi:hypothetical protein
VTSKPLSSSSLYCSRLNRAFLARKHPSGPDLWKDDRGAEDIPIVMGHPQSEPQQDHSVGDKEDFGIYAELRESDKFRTSLFLHSHLVLLSMMYHSLTFSSYARRVLCERAAKGSNRLRVCRIRRRRTFIPSPQDAANLAAQAPKISGIGNNTHVLTWATKHACARVHQTFLEDDGESNLAPEDEEPDDPLEDAEDAEEPLPNQDLFTPVPPNKKGLSTVTIIVCSG